VGHVKTLKPCGLEGVAEKLPAVAASAFTTPKARAMEFVNEGVLLGPRTLITVEMTAMSSTATDTANIRRGCVHANQ
jgi:hypothetical protein